MEKAGVLHDGQGGGQLEEVLGLGLLITPDSLCIWRLDLLKVLDNRLVPL